MGKFSKGLAASGAWSCFGSAPRVTYIHMHVCMYTYIHIYIYIYIYTIYTYIPFLLLLGDGQVLQGACRFWRLVVLWKCTPCYIYTYACMYIYIYIYLYLSISIYLYIYMYSNPKPVLLLLGDGQVLQGTRRRWRLVLRLE